MKCKLLVGSLALLLIQPAFAVTTPSACPSIEAVKSVGLTAAEYSSRTGWAVMNYKNHFNTPQEWTFVLLGVNAKYASEALMKGNQALNSLYLIDGPEGNCMYINGDYQGNFLWAVAITPPIPPDKINRFS